LGIFDRPLARALPLVPEPVVRRVARRYIAGEDIGAAVDVVRSLNGIGRSATIDVLGEDVLREEEAAAVVAGYLEALAAIEDEGLSADLSVKPSAVGLALGADVCFQNLVRLVGAAAERENQVEIDMEGSRTTSDTLALYRQLRESGHDNVVIVLQAALRRTFDDVLALAPLRPSVRVCKGIYVEPPTVAYRSPDTIRFSFVKAVERLLDQGSFVAIATHDSVLADACLQLVEQRGLSSDRYECQMLLGVRPELGDRLVAEGHPLRVYVPYGRRWYDYSMRRLQANPAVAAAIAAETIRGLGR
jgi:proline dehydrogenase